MDRSPATIEVFLFIAAFPGWAIPYIFVISIGGWDSGALGLAVPWLWPLLWMVLLAAHVARRAISRSKAPQTILVKPSSFGAFAPSPFGSWLKRVREQHLGWTQHELAMVCGVPIGLVI